MPSSTFFFPQKCRVFFGTPILSECLFVETLFKSALFLCLSLLGVALLLLLSSKRRPREPNRQSFLSPRLLLPSWSKKRIVVSWLFFSTTTTQSGFESARFGRRKMDWNISPSVIPTKVTKSSRLNQSRRPFPPKPTRRRREHHQHGVAFRSLSLSLSPQKKKKKTTTTTAFVGVETHRWCDVREIYSRRLVPFLALFECLPPSKRRQKKKKDAFSKRLSHL